MENEQQLCDNPPFLPPRKRLGSKNKEIDLTCESDDEGSEMVDDPRNYVPEDWRRDVIEWIETHPDPPAACYNVYTNKWFEYGQ